MLTQIRNAQARGYAETVLPYSKIKFEVAQILKNKGFIAEAEKKKRKTKKSEFNILAIGLKYNNGVSAVGGVKMVSRPSRRVYAGKEELKPIMSGFGISIVSTPKGIMTGDDAKKAGVGGEILFEIW